MRKLYLITSILLLSSVWLAAQTYPSSGGAAQQPSTTSPSTAPSQTSPTQSTAPDTSATSTDKDSVEGCLSGSAGNFTLTDSAGKSWQLAGDTSKLTEHVGHMVRLSGSQSGGSSSPSSSGASGAAGAGSSASSGGTFTVSKVKMISSSCPTSK